MKKIISIAALALALTTTSADAISRYNALDHSCGDIQSILERQGAAIFRYPSSRIKGLTLYDRYVQSGGFCDPYQISKRVPIPSRDNDQCQVLHCIPDDCDGGGFDGCL